jgi:hypothetical protein
VTIEKGEDWGRRGRLPDDAPVVSTDREILPAAARSTRRPPIVGLAGGDLHRTVGGPGAASRLGTDETYHLPIDVGIARLDGVEHRFVAHLVARRSWWYGPVLVVANAQFIGEWNVAPRAHPGDGLLDALLVEEMSVRDRWAARGRLRSGTHVPHPAITVRRRPPHSWTFTRPLDVYLDGRRVTRATRIEVDVDPDALVVVV